MNRLLTIVHLTLHEAVRKRILLATTLCGIAFLILYAVGYHFIAKNLPNDSGAFAAGRRLLQLAAFTLAGLYAVNFLTIMSAVLLPVDTLSGEINSGVMQTLASKPIRRAEIVLGKWLAYSGVVAVYVLVLAGGVLAIARTMGGYTPPNAYVGLPLMMFEGVLLVTLSVWGGVRFSTVTNGIVAFGLYGIAFLGSWVEQVGAWSHNTAAQNVGTFASLIMPTECLWQLAAHHMQPPFLAQLHLTPFSPASVPSPAMLVWAVGWGLAALFGAITTFRKRPL
jgi:Cu-processing system permease protein